MSSGLRSGLLILMDQQTICGLLKQAPKLQVERKQLTSAWRKVLQAIQARVKAELGSLPATLQPEEGQGTDYTAVKHIRDTLAETANKSLLGGLKGTAGLWDKIVKAYQARSELIWNTYTCSPSAASQSKAVHEPWLAPGSQLSATQISVWVIHLETPGLPVTADVWLGEAGQSLIRAVDHEIPYLRKQSAQLQLQVIDLERRHADLLKSAALAAKEYKQVGLPARQDLWSPCIL